MDSENERRQPERELDRPQSVRPQAASAVAKSRKGPGKRGSSFLYFNVFFFRKKLTFVDKYFW